MNIFQAIILGLVQGATEFIPVSSSGHLVLVPWLLGWQPPGLTFALAAHVGTAFAVLVYFIKDWLNMATGLWRWMVTRKLNDDVVLLGLLVIGCIPVAVLGFTLRDQIAAAFESPTVAALMLIGTAILLLASDREYESTREIKDATWRDALLIGVTQSLAVLPGLSRSGATIAGGLLRRLNREDAARYSFLLALPVIFGANAFEAIGLAQDGINSVQATTLLAGFLTSFASGYLVIRWLLNYLKTRSTRVFAFYCIGAAAFCLVLLGLRGQFTL